MAAGISGRVRALGLIGPKWLNELLTTRAQGCLLCDSSVLKTALKEAGRRSSKM